MRKIYVLSVAIILVISGLIIVANADDNTYEEKSIEQSITISNPVITNSDQYISVTFNEATSYISYAGEPMLPVFTKVFILPFGSKIKNVDVVFSESKELLLSKDVKPVPEPTPVSSTEQNIDDTVRDEEIYGSSEVYPSNIFSYNIGAGLNGNDNVIYLTVRCYPVRYSPANKIIYYTNNIHIKLVYDEPATPVMSSDQYDLVIISPSEFSNEIQSLIEHKINMGVDTFLETTEDIYSKYNGFDKAEKIKYFIKDAKETLGIDYVLLVGSVDKLPIRYTYASFWGDTLPTDLYYADIYDENDSFCSWDANGNGKYGEVHHDHHQVYDIDGVDFYPDINVGRLPCTKKTEVKVVVNKIIHYETETYGESWFNNIILVGGDTFPGNNGNEGEQKNLMTEQIMSDFIPTQLWTSDDTFSAASLNKAINKGAGFFDYSGHGFEIGVSTHPPNSEEWVGYHTNHLLGATNGYELPIVFFDACLTAKLDFNVNNLTSYLSDTLNNIISQFNIGSMMLPCFAWCCVAKPRGGFIASIGATRTAYGSLDYGCGYLSIHFWQAYSTSETISQMLTKAQNQYITNIPGDFFTVEEFILIGDPSLKIGGYPQSKGLKTKILNDEENINGYPDIPLQFQASANNGQSPYVFTWDFNEDGVYGDANGENVEWTWDSPGVYQISVKVIDSNKNENTYNTIVCIESKTSQPTGSISGKPGIEYTFTAQASEGILDDQTYVFYYFDWGDGTYSDVLGPYPADSPVEVSHTWGNIKSYNVRVKALKINFKNFAYEETGWSDPLPVTISKSKQSNTHSFSIFLERLLQHFPRLEKFLQFFL